MPESNNKEQIGAIVRARTIVIQKATSNLVQRAVQDIERLSAEPRVSELIEQMTISSDWKNRENAWIELRKMGPTYRGWAESLRSVIYTGDGWDRIFSAEALSRFSCNPEDAVPVLTATIEACLDREDYGWGWLACGALGNFKVLDSKLVEHVLPVLIRVIEETPYNNADVSTDKRNMRGYSILALGNYGNLAKPALLKLAPLLEHRDDPLWQAYFDTAQKIDPRAKSQLAALIVSLSSRDAPTRGEAACSIAKLGSAGISAIPELLALANDDSCDVRRFLAIALAKLGQTTPEIIKVLNALTQDADDSVQVGAFYSLVCLRENQQDNLQELLEFLSHDDSFVRFLSTWAVGEVGCIDREKAISWLTRAFTLEEDTRMKDLMEESIEKVRRC